MEAEADRAEGAEGPTWVGTAVVDSSDENGPPHADRSTGEAPPPHSDGSSGRADGGGMGEITGMEEVVTAGGEAAAGAGKAEAILVGPVNAAGPEPADLADSIGPTGPVGPTGPADLVGPTGPAEPTDLVGPVRADRDRREGPADEDAWWRYLTWPICGAGVSSRAS